MSLASVETIQRIANDLGFRDAALFRASLQ